MQEEEGLVSIIVPCFNGQEFVEELLLSIIEQTYLNWVVIFIDDGSTDQTASIVKRYSLKYPRIEYSFHSNRGVSRTRNVGLKMAKGEFVIFFDADDKMAPDYLKNRIDLLNSNNTFDFCCSDILTFPNEKRVNGAILDIPRELLITRVNISSCPSNYLFRRKALLFTNVVFDTRLFNAADRLFLLQISQYLKGGYVKLGGELYYRVHENAMSRQVNGKMVKDNVRYVELVKSLNLIPNEYNSLALCKMYIVVGMLALKSAYYKTAAKYLFKSFFINPKHFIHRLIK